MHISKNIKVVDLGLYLEKYQALIVSDFHLGYEEYLNSKGVLIPKLSVNNVLKRLNKIILLVKPEIIIINGDLKHEFGKISNQEWRDSLRVLDFLSKKCDKLFLIKGNHDSILEPIAMKREIETVNSIVFGNILVIHGDKLVKIHSKVKTIIIGHEHPAVIIGDKTRIETYKCFLSGKYKRKNLIVQPSFNLITEGTNVLQRKLLSPYLQQDLKKFNVFIVSDKIYDFGKVNNFR